MAEFPCSGMSARTADYICSAPRASASAIALQLVVEPADGLDVLGEVRGRLKKLKHSPAFLASVFDERDKQLSPRDLLIAWVPSKSRRAKQQAAAGGVVGGAKQQVVAGRRVVGMLRRSMRFDKEQGRASLYIDFIWVVPECRGMQIGRQLLLHGLLLGKQKDVRLMVAGSDANKAAVGLYSSVGFRWTDSSQSEMLLEAENVVGALAAARARLMESKLTDGEEEHIIEAPPRPASVSPSESSSCHSEDTMPAATGEMVLESELLDSNCH